MGCKKRKEQRYTGPVKALQLSEARTPDAFAVVNAIARQKQCSGTQAAVELIIAAGKSKARRIAVANWFKNVLRRMLGFKKVKLSKNA